MLRLPAEPHVSLGFSRGCSVILTAESGTGDMERGKIPAQRCLCLIPAPCSDWGAHSCEYSTDTATWQMNYGCVAGKLILGGSKRGVSWCCLSWLHCLKLFGEEITLSGMVCLAAADSTISTQLWDCFSIKTLPFQLSSLSRMVFVSHEAEWSSPDGADRSELGHNCIFSKLQSRATFVVICCNGISVLSKIL